MAHKKGQGSSRNGRDSNAKRRGLKVACGQEVTSGSILVLQCGSRFIAGKNVKQAKNDSLFALSDGVMTIDGQGRRVNIVSKATHVAAIAAGDAARAAAAAHAGATV